jgi:hypothetical protein
MGRHLRSVDLGSWYDDRGIENISNNVDDGWKVCGGTGREDS